MGDPILENGSNDYMFVYGREGVFKAESLGYMRTFIRTPLDIEESLLLFREELNFKNTYLGEFNVKMGTQREVRAIALLSTMQHLNDTFGKKMSNTNKPYHLKKRHSSFWRRRPVRWFRKTVVCKTLVAGFGVVAGPFKYIHHHFFGDGQRKYRQVNPWVPGYPYGRSDLDY